MTEKQPARYAVEVTRESVEAWTIYVSANSPEEANEVADEIVQNCTFPDYELIHSEYYLDAQPISPRHEVAPTRLGDDQGMVCAACLKTVVWTGIAADDPDNRSGRTIPVRGVTYEWRTSR